MRRGQQLALAAGGTSLAGAALVVALDRAWGIPDPLSDVALAAGFLSITVVPLALLVVLPLIDPDARDSTSSGTIPPETVPPATRCGATVDRYRSGVFPPRAATRERLVDRLRRAAVTALVEERGHTRSAAREAVATGAWTDDPHAARLLADDAEPPRAVLFTYYLRAAAGEIDALREADQ